MRRILLAVVVALAVCASPVVAAPAEVKPVKSVSARNEPVDIKADATEYRGKDNLVIFLGNVVAVQGSVTINSDRLEVSLHPETKEISQIRALGSVSVRREDMLATGQSAVYELKDDTITLTGSPKIWRGPDAVEGERVVMHLNDERLEVKGQARVVLNPPARKKDAEK